MRSARSIPTSKKNTGSSTSARPRLADTPEAFDVIVMPNLYGDILSDVAAQIAGSVGLAGSANIGDRCAMFEAIHGSAPRRAGQNLANPSGLLLGGVMMLVHIGQPDVAERVHNAWLRTIEEGIHTYDIFEEGVSKQKVGTKEFARGGGRRMGKKPETLKAGRAIRANRKKACSHALHGYASARRELVGVDVFFDWRRPQSQASSARSSKPVQRRRSRMFAALESRHRRSGRTASKKRSAPTIGAAAS